MTPGSEVRVRIPGEPCAQGRPRTAVIAGRARVFDPKKSRSWKGEARTVIEAAVLAAASSVRVGDDAIYAIPFPDGPLEVHVLAVFTCAKGDWRKRETRPRRRHAKKPDGENVAKAVLDAATGVLWRDDSQVSDLYVVKRIGAQGEAPYVEICVRPVPETLNGVSFNPWRNEAMSDKREAYERWCECGHNEATHKGSWRCRGLVEHGRYKYSSCMCQTFTERKAQ